jgi:hypothetical protein
VTWTDGWLTSRARRAGLPASSRTEPWAQPYMRLPGPSPCPARPLPTSSPPLPCPPASGTWSLHRRLRTRLHACTPPGCWALPRVLRPRPSPPERGLHRAGPLTPAPALLRLQPRGAEGPAGGALMRGGRQGQGPRGRLVLARGPCRPEGPSPAQPGHAGVLLPSHAPLASPGRGVADPGAHLASACPPALHPSCRCPRCGATAPCPSPPTTWTRTCTSLTGGRASGGGVYPVMLKPFPSQKSRG